MIPIMLSVSNAIRIDSVEPLIDGVPVHDADLGMFAVLQIQPW